MKADATVRLSIFWPSIIRAIITGKARPKRRRRNKRTLRRRLLQSIPWEAGDALIKAGVDHLRAELAKPGVAPDLAGIMTAAADYADAYLAGATAGAVASGLRRGAVCTPEAASRAVDPDGKPFTYETDPGLCGKPSGGWRHKKGLPAAVPGVALEAQMLAAGVERLAIETPNAIGRALTQMIRTGRCEYLDLATAGLVLDHAAHIIGAEAVPKGRRPAVEAGPDTETKTFNAAKWLNSALGAAHQSPAAHARLAGRPLRRSWVSRNQRDDLWRAAAVLFALPVLLHPQPKEGGKA
jgi:hypothetical protein